MVAEIAVLSSLLGPGGLSGLLGSGGGQKVDVNQSSSNTTSVNLSSLLSNQSPDAKGGNVSGGATGTAQSASGTDLLPSPLATPISGFNSLGATDEFNASVEPQAVPKTVFYASAAIVAAIGVYALFGKKRR